ncbi:unnamed protein product [Cylicocyclus nassatus]|uniref:Uncharacterized protein n=1 Tax=Cylicocyclus nassatus TaxID=53992 RepID=A0AA36GLY1_CYLNA|nr:unnamed protein product [Cylicocyclus nassatus]
MFEDQQLLSFDYSNTSSGLVYYRKEAAISGGLFDPYAYFEGQHFMTSSMETISRGQFDKSISLLLCRDLPFAAVQEGLVIEKDRIVAPLTIAVGTYSLWVPKHTLYRYESFFILPILSVAGSREETFIRLLLAQKLLNLANSSLAFYPIESNTSSGYGDAKIDHRTPELINVSAFLRSWKCPHSKLPDCMVLLIEEFVDKRYLDEDWLLLTSYWVKELSKISYRFPSVHEPNFDCLYLLDEPSRRQNCRRSSIYFPNFSAANMNKLRNWRKKTLSDLSKWCAKAHCYSGEFPEIIFPFNYIHISRVELMKGIFFNYCLSKAKELNLRNVKGYFLAGDDAIFNFWHKLDLSEILFPVDGGELFQRNWWWTSRYGKRATKRASRIFEEMSRVNNKIKRILACYQKGLIENGYNEDALVHIARDTSKTLSDFFYVPQKRLVYIAEVIEVFFEAGVFVELTMMKILQTVLHIRPDLSRFVYLPYHYRRIWYEFYDSEKIMVHPIKINIAGARFCSTVVKTFQEVLIPQLKSFNMR